MSRIFVLSSVTYALKAQELLKAANIYSTLVRGGNIRKIRACGQGVSVGLSDGDNAAAVLKKGGISVLGEVTEK